MAKRQTYRFMKQKTECRNTSIQIWSIIFDKGAKAIQQRKEKCGFFKKINGVRTTRHLHAKKERKKEKRTMIQDVITYTKLTKNGSQI